MYINYQGIKGEANAKGHEDWIDVLSLDWGVSRAINSTTGTRQNREATSPNISEVTFTKLTDDSTPYLFREACTQGGKEVKIHLTKTADNLENYLEYTLTDCIVSNYMVSTDGERPIETISLSFTKIELRYTPHDNTGKAVSPISQIYNISKATME